MYKHCIFCKCELGQNQIIESFPTGRRLAFDGAKGRLWVVCRHCKRWNLSPLEERWEAIEQCERLYRDTRTRVATENIGLARLGDGSDIVRIGSPKRPEFAAWRYGDTLIRRRRKEFLAGSVLLAGGLTGYLAGSALLGFAGSMMLQQGIIGLNFFRLGRTAVRIPDDQGKLIGVNRLQLRSAAFHPEGHRWFLRVHHKQGYIDYTESRAIKIAGMILPHINQAGASRAQISSAIHQIEESLGPAHLFEQAVQKLGYATRYTPKTIHGAPSAIRLALEMAAHEEQERRALEGELAELELLWREAEQIAAISDDLLLPESVANLFKRRKRDTPG